MDFSHLDMVLDSKYKLNAYRTYSINKQKLTPKKAFF